MEKEKAKETQYPAYVIRNPSPTQLWLFDYVTQMLQNIALSSAKENKSSNECAEINIQENLKTKEQFYIYCPKNRDLYYQVIVRAPIFINTLDSITTNESIIQGLTKLGYIRSQQDLIDEIENIDIAWIDAYNKLYPLGLSPLLSIPKNEDNKKQIEALANKLSTNLANNDIFSLVVGGNNKKANFYLEYNPIQNLSLREATNERQIALNTALIEAEKLGLNNLTHYNAIGSINSDKVEWLARDYYGHANLRKMDNRPLIQEMPEYKEVLKKAKQNGLDRPIYIIKDGTRADLNYLSHMATLMYNYNKTLHDCKFSTHLIEHNDTNYVILTSKDADLQKFLIERAPMLINKAKETTSYDISKIPYVITKNGECLESDLLPVCTFPKSKNNINDIKKAIEIMQTKEAQNCRIAYNENKDKVTCYLKNHIREKAQHTTWKSLRTKKREFLSAIKNIEIECTPLDDFGSEIENYYCQHKSQATISPLAEIIR